MTNNLLLNSLIGDSLSLGAHWIYSQSEIAEKLGHITGYFSPATSYHPGKQAGDFTHYGDQVMVLLRSIAKQGRFDLRAFATDWEAFWNHPATVSYRDGATKATLQNLQKGVSADMAASPSNDISAAARMAPLFMLKWSNDEALIAAVKAQAAFTHGDPVVAEAAEFFARVTLDVTRGNSIPEALRTTAAMPHWRAIPSDWFAAATASAHSSQTDHAATKAHGLTCHTPDAFPAICHLLLRHPDDAAAALTINATAGGDNAARGLILGMIHGARPDAAPLPAEWLSGLRAAGEIQDLLNQIHRHD